MWSKVLLPRRRGAVDAWACFLVITVAFIAVTTVARWNQNAVIYFMVLCAVVCFLPRFIAFGLAALAGPLGGVATWPQAGAALGLLLLAPVIISAGAAVCVALYQTWREMNTPLERLAIARALRPWVQGAVMAGLVLGGLFEGGWFVGSAVEVGAMIIPLAAYRRSHYTTATTAAVIASMVTGWSTAPLVLAGVSLGLLLFRVATGGLPRQWHPLPSPSLWRHPGAASRCRRCDHRIARSDILGARHVLGAGTGAWVRLRIAFLDLEERMYQSALSFGRETGLPGDIKVPAQILRARGLSGTAQYDQARALYLQVLSAVRQKGRLYHYLVLLLAENDLAAGQPADAIQAAAWLAARPDWWCDYFMRQRALRVLAEYELDQGNTEAASQVIDQAMEALAANRAIIRLTDTNSPGKLVRNIYGSRGSMYIHPLRVESLSRAAQPRVEDQAEDAGNRDGWEPELVALVMAVARSSDDLVELYLSEARNAVADGQRGEALPLAARALMELDRTRYLLAAQSSRTSWSRRFQRVLDFALATAHAEQDHEFVAELLEFARVQTLPAASAEISEDLALSTPPIILVNSQARLARPGEQNRPACVSLEHAAEPAAGAGAWWLSYWATHDWLYWALVAPSGDTSSGRVSFSATSALRKTLDELEWALPALLPGENPIEADFRLSKSLLLTDPARELVLSATLGSLLLPRPLIQAAARKRARGEERLRLAIAPAAALGYIPWSILVAGDPTASDPERLVDVCDWVLAPSAALVCHAAPRISTRSPLALAVADTTDDRGLGELPGARAQAAALPRTVRVLGGHHWSPDPATLTRLERELRAVGPDATVAFMCHAVRGTADEPSKGGIVLAPGGQGTAADQYDILTPQAVFAMNKRGLTMPSQVILQACDSSALKDTTSGEWLTIAPAFISAGSREVVATVYPLVDLPGVDDPVTRAALRGDSLQAAVAQMQREGLTRWTSGHHTDSAHTPFVWGAYATVAIQPKTRTSASTAPSSPLAISASLMRVLGKAVRTCQRTRAKRLDSGYILGELLEDGSLSDVLDGAGNSMHPIAFAWTLGPYICTRYLHIRDQDPATPLRINGKTINVPGTVIHAIRAGRTAAERDGLPLTPHHVVNALLSEPTAARRIVAYLGMLTRKRPTLIHRAIEWELTEQISNRLTAWSEPAQPGQHHDLVEAVLAHAYAETSTLNGDSSVTERSAFDQPLAISNRPSGHEK